MLVILFLYHSHAHGASEVNIPKKIICENQNLKLQGSGVRTATIFKIKIYELGIYSKHPNFYDRPACYEITYFRDFDHEDVVKAWNYQFKESSEYAYPDSSNDLIKLKSFFSKIAGQRKHTFTLIKDTTRIYENGVLKGEIKGKDFQKSFISIWTGKNPPTEQLQKELFKTMIKEKF